MYLRYQTLRMCERLSKIKLSGEKKNPDIYIQVSRFDIYILREIHSKAHEILKIKHSWSSSNYLKCQCVTFGLIYGFYLGKSSIYCQKMYY